MSFSWVLWPAVVWICARCRQVSGTCRSSLLAIIRQRGRNSLLGITIAIPNKVQWVSMEALDEGLVIAPRIGPVYLRDSSVVFFLAETIALRRKIMKSEATPSCGDRRSRLLHFHLWWKCVRIEHVRFRVFRYVSSKYVFVVGHLKCEAHNRSNTYEVAW